MGNDLQGGQETIMGNGLQSGQENIMGNVLLSGQETIMGNVFTEWTRKQQVIFYRVNKKTAGPVVETKE